MFRVPALLIVILIFAVPARAAPSHLGELSTLESVQKWMYGYRARPEPGRVADAVRTLSQLGALKDPETSGIYVGFLAGAIGANPAKADELVAKLFPVPPAEQWVIVRAIAYSGHPQWKHLILKYASRMPARKVMIEKYLARELATLNEVPLEHPDPGFMDKVRGYFSFSGENKPAGKSLTFESNPELLDTLLGYYFASGSFGPILRVVRVLQGPQQRRQAQRRQHGEIHAFHVRDARPGAARIAQERAQPPVQGNRGDPQGSDRGGRHCRRRPHPQGGAGSGRGTQAQGPRLQARYLVLGPGGRGRRLARLRCCRGARPDRVRHRLRAPRRCA